MKQTNGQLLEIRTRHVHLTLELDLLISIEIYFTGKYKKEKTNIERMKCFLGFLQVISLVNKWKKTKTRSKRQETGMKTDPMENCWTLQLVEEVDSKDKALMK